MCGDCVAAKPCWTAFSIRRSSSNAPRTLSAIRREASGSFGEDVAHLKPIVAGVLLVDGRQEIVRVHDEGGHVMFRLRAAGARRHEDGLDERMTRIANFVMLQSIASA